MNTAEKPKLVVDNKGRQFDETEREKIRAIWRRRDMSQRTVLLSFDFTEEGDEYASLTHPDAKSVMHITKCAKGYFLDGENRDACFFESLDEIVHGIGILRPDVKTTLFDPAIHDSI